ncbi:hypothetical protein RclHR1_05800002 [Rhizophagus clarus]|uniref:Uncharacterized protein n=1 Tax=Rhizophagus clarus TaxID=94130 RepID=A0A2Z6S1K1_9GLOM|nr:hypothetical protein RclHR1_05800002 [Rhizophagus clarus]GES88031.1 hypothetical protein GLOIN_2v1875106 [Rhizophagus clarus]
MASASFLLSECLEIIFSKLTEYPSSDVKINVPTKDLYSCTLVSRHWCRVATPLLYAYPFHHFRYNYSRQNYYKLIRTLLSCIQQFDKNVLQLPHNDINSNITFNYIPLIRGLVFNKFMFRTKLICDEYNKRIWLSEYNLKNISDTSIITIMDNLIKFICKHCNNLTTLEFSFLIRNDDDIIKLLTLKGHNGESKLSNLKELYYPRHILYSQNINILNSFYLSPLNNVHNLKLLYVCKDGFNSDTKARLLSKFISSQKMLQHFILSGTIKYENEYNFDNEEVLANFFNKLLYNDNNDYSFIINSLTTQSETLQILEFIDLGNIIINLNSLQSFKNIRKLKLDKCMINDLHYWLMDLKNLKVFEITKYDTTESSLFKLIQSIQSITSNLAKLIINDECEFNDYTELYKQIPLYLYSLTHLKLPHILVLELIPIFNSCTNLVYLSVVLLEEETEMLNRLGKSVPKTLKRIQFRKLLGTSRISAPYELLEAFLEACVNNGSILKYVEYECKDLEKSNDNVTERYGIKVIKYSK